MLSQIQWYLTYIQNDTASLFRALFTCSNDTQNCILTKENELELYGMAILHGPYMSKTITLLL